MIHLFLDTNVVIDFLTDRKPFSLFAAKLFDFSEKGKVRLYLAAVSYHNIYHILRKLTSHKEALQTLRALDELAETIDTSATTIKNALNADFKDFEDAIQYFSAGSNTRISGIVTRNTSDFKQSNLPVWTPEQAITFIESSNG